MIDQKDATDSNINYWRSFPKKYIYGHIAETVYGHFLIELNRYRSTMKGSTKASKSRSGLSMHTSFY